LCKQFANAFAALTINVSADYLQSIVSRCQILAMVVFT